MTIVVSESWRQHSLRLYGAFCLTGNILLFVKGATSGDILIALSGTVGTVAQLANSARGDEVKSYTVPALITAALLFLSAGLRSGNQEHMIFGSIKACGLIVLFYGCYLFRRPPGETAWKRMPRFSPEILGEIMLAIAAIALGVDGYHRLSHGIGGMDIGEIVDGAVTLAATAGFIAGQRFAVLTQERLRFYPV